MKVYVYTLSDPTSKEVRYVGKSVKSLPSRLTRHISKSALSKNNHRTNWIKSVIKIGKIPIIEHLDEFDSDEEAYYFEQYWINQFRAWGFNLVNSTDGGKGSFGYKHSKESMEKILKCNRASAQKRRIHFKVPMTKEEHAVYLSKLYSKPVLQYSLAGEFIKEWESAALAATSLGFKSKTTVTSCIYNTISKSGGGFMWKLKSQEDFSLQIPPCTPHSFRVVVKLQINNKIEVFPSVLEAMRLTGFSREKILKLKINETI